MLHVAALFLGAIVFFFYKEKYNPYKKIKKKNLNDVDKKL
jgi:hypothetical protein